MESMFNLAVAPGYRGGNKLPHDAKLWNVVIDILNGGYSYNFTLTLPEIPVDSCPGPQFAHAFSFQSLESYANLLKLGGRFIFIVNSLCVGLQRFMIAGSPQARGSSLPAHIVFKFDGGTSVSFDTTFHLESDDFKEPVWAISNSITLHRTIDLAAYFVENTMPSPVNESSPAYKFAMAKQVREPEVSSPDSLDPTHHAVSPDSSLFDAYHSFSLEVANSDTVDTVEMIARVLVCATRRLHERGIAAGPAAFVICVDSLHANSIADALRNVSIDSNFVMLQPDGGKYRNDGKTFNSCLGRGTVDEEHFDLAFIKIPICEELTVDTRRRSKLAASLPDADDELIILKVRSMPTVAGTYDIFNTSGHESNDNEAVLRFRNKSYPSLGGMDHLRSVIWGSFDVSKEDDRIVCRFVLPDHPIFSEFFLRDPSNPKIFLCRPEDWKKVLQGRAYILAASQVPTFQHVRSAKTPLQCYAALKHGRSSPLPINVLKTFRNADDDYWGYLRILPSSIFSCNPRFLEMVIARYNELLELCCKYHIDAPKEFVSLFFSPASHVLLSNLFKFRDSLEDASRVDRVLPFEAMAILCSVSFFCILRMYLHAYKLILGHAMNPWTLQDLLWRLTAFGSWAEKRLFLVLKFTKLFYESTDDDDDE